jgi:hypothetical protein
VHVEPQFLSDSLNVLETLLVVRARATHPDLRLVLIESWRNFAEGSDNAFESGRDLWLD